MDDYKNVYVLIEEMNGRIPSIGYELLSEAQRLVKGSEKLVCAIVCCKKDSMVGQNLIYGADIIYELVCPVEQETYTETKLMASLLQLVRKHSPEVFLFGATTRSRELAAELAAKLDTGLTADCIQLQMDWDSGLLSQVRPAYEGNLMATILCKEKRPQMATIRSGVMKKSFINKERKGEVIRIMVEEQLHPRVEVLKRWQSSMEENQLVHARTVIGIGNGIASPENIAYIQKLAVRNGIVVGTTRPVVDSGMLPEECQIGLSGVSIQAEYYIACGISGAVQHLSGIQNVKNVIAINQDDMAPIFQMARYGIIGDAMEILPNLIHQIYGTE